MNTDFSEYTLRYCKGHTVVQNIYSLAANLCSFVSLLGLFTFSAPISGYIKQSVHLTSISGSNQYKPIPLTDRISYIHFSMVRDDWPSDTMCHGEFFSLGFWLTTRPVVIENFFPLEFWTHDPQCITQRITNLMLYPLSLMSGLYWQLVSISVNSDTTFR